MQLRASVKCVADGHPRENQAGTVQAINADQVAVKFDLAEEVEEVAAVDLVQLGAN